MGSRLVGSGLPAKQRLWTDHGPLGSYASPGRVDAPIKMIPAVCGRRDRNLGSAIVDSKLQSPSRASAVSSTSSMAAQNRYVSPRLKNTISLDGGDCCKNVPVRKPAKFTAAKKCSRIAQRISRLG